MGRVSKETKEHYRSGVSGTAEISEASKTVSRVEGKRGVEGMYWRCLPGPGPLGVSQPLGLELPKHHDHAEGRQECIYF